MRTSTFRATFFAPVLLVLLLLQGCGAGINQGDVNLVSIEEEWQLGRQLEAQLAQELQLVRDPATVAYVERLGQAIVAQTQMANLPWKFHVVADPAINAFNIPGGHVYVNTGLIKEAGSAAELASVMAHEVAHGVARHGTERLTKQYGLSIAAGLLLGEDPGLIKQIAAQIVGTGAIAKFSRNDERESDRLGIRYMYDAGYDPAGMAAMFERLLAEQRRRPSGVEAFFSTHPLTQDRIADARRRAAELPARSGLVTNDGRFRDVQRRL